MSSSFSSGASGGGSERLDAMPLAVMPVGHGVVRHGEGVHDEGLPFDGEGGHANAVEPAVTLAVGRLGVVATRTSSCGRACPAGACGGAQGG